MKILKYTILGLLVILFLIILMGIANPSIGYGHEIMVDKPIKEAWAVSQDDKKYDQWLEGFKSFELIEGEKWKEGSKYKVVVDPGDGQPEFEMIETLVSINDFESVEMHFDSEFMNFEQVMHFTEERGKTSVKTESKVLAKGLMMRSMFAIMEIFGGSFTAQEKKNMEALKKLIEENTTDYYPRVRPSIDNTQEQ